MRGRREELDDGAHRSRGSAARASPGGWRGRTGRRSTRASTIPTSRPSTDTTAIRERSGLKCRRSSAFVPPADGRDHVVAHRRLLEREQERAIGRGRRPQSERQPSDEPVGDATTGLRRRPRPRRPGRRRRRIRCRSARGPVTLVATTAWRSCATRFEAARREPRPPTTASRRTRGTRAAIAPAPNQSSSAKRERSRRGVVVLPLLARGDDRDPVDQPEAQRRGNEATDRDGVAQTGHDRERAPPPRSTVSMPPLSDGTTNRSSASTRVALEGDSVTRAAGSPRCSPATCASNRRATASRPPSAAMSSGASARTTAPRSVTQRDQGRERQHVDDHDPVAARRRLIEPGPAPLDVHLAPGPNVGSHHEAGYGRSDGGGPRTMADPTEPNEPLADRPTMFGGHLEPVLLPWTLGHAPADRRAELLDRDHPARRPSARASGLGRVARRRVLLLDRFARGRLPRRPGPRSPCTSRAGARS